MSKQAKELTATIMAVTDLWDEPLDEVHDVRPLVSAIIADGWKKENN